MERKVIPIIPKRLIYIREPNPIRFFFFGIPDGGLTIANFKFRIRFGKPRTHILIRTPLFCFERHNGGTIIGNKHQLYFVKWWNRKEGAEQECL